MSQILQTLQEVDPTDSDAVKEVITSFFQNLIKHKQENCNIWLRALEDVITRFPRYCSQHRHTVENYLVHFLESSNYYNVIVAAKCAHALQQIRPSLDKLASPKNCWREQMAILCNTAHTLIEAIFSKSVNLFKTNQNARKKEPELLTNSPLTTAFSNILKVKKSRESSEEKNTVLCNKLRNLFVFIQAMLVEAYPVAKPVQPQLILQVIVQALSMSSSVNTDPQEATTVKIEALKTLDAMILCLGPNLIPFSGLVFRFVMQTLKWSSENPNVESRKVRIAAYNSLTKWLSELHVHQVPTEGRGRPWEEELTKHILEDITPAKKIVQLTMSNQYIKNLSKKAKRKLRNQTLEQSAIASHMPGEKNKANAPDEPDDEVANAALECAETFLTVCGIFLKPTTHKAFQDRLVRECFSLQAYSATRALNLLRALDAARKNTGTQVPPPTQYCLQLYSVLVNSRCDEIRKFCTHALLDIRLHLHCSPPSINFQLDAQPETDKADKNKRKELSKSNRAALEYLINEGAGPSNAGDSAGEPTTKKPRLEEDRISISSESDVSVVIPDEGASDDEVQEINEENNDFDVEMVPEPETDEVEIVAGPTAEKPSQETSEESKESTESTDNIVTVEDSADITDAYQNSRKRKLSEPTEAVSIYEAKTQVPLNTSTDTIDNSPPSVEVAYDAPNVDNKVVVLERPDDETLPSTNETDDIQITCGQTVVVSQEIEPAKDNVEVEIEISAVATEPAEIEENEELEINVDAVAANDNNIEVKITSQEISVEDMLADFVDEVIEEPNLVA